MVINLPMAMSAIKFDKCQVAAILSLIYCKVKTCCQCVATRGYSPFPFSDVFCYVMEPFKMYQDVIQHGVLIGFWHCTSIKWIPPENQKQLSDESVEVWHIETFTSLEFFSVKLSHCGEVCGRSAAKGDILVAFLCSLRCLVDCSAKWSKPIHALKFISQICGMYVPQASRINSPVHSECLTPYSTKFSSIGTSSVKNIK